MATPRTTFRAADQYVVRVTTRIRDLDTGTARTVSRFYPQRLGTPTVMVPRTRAEAETIAKRLETNHLPGERAEVVPYADALRETGPDGAV